MNSHRGAEAKERRKNAIQFRPLCPLWLCGYFLLSALCFTGCASRTVVIDSRADVVRLGPGVKGRVYVFRDGAWTLTGKVTLPEGWFAGPPPP